MAIFSQLNAQSADIQAGCIPLTVQFTGPSASNYFWEFKDGASSNLQNPEHIFTNAGEYNVELYSSQGGTLVGNVTIKVYPDLIIQIETDSIMGCIPMDVQFRPDITKDPDITITSYLWTFGDGGSSNQAEPIYTYNSEGIYDISLQVTTSIGECNKTEIFSDYVTVRGVEAKFVANKFSSCAAPDIFTFTNNTEQLSGNTYSWDFGNGETYDGYQPPSINFTANGLYEISLSVTSSTGCVSTARRNINIGPPIINIPFDKIACLNSLNILNSGTIADEYIWDFGNNPNVIAENTDEATALVEFLETGEYEVSFTAISLLGCTSDTTFTMTIDQVNPNFTLGPEVTCGEGFTVILEAEELNYQQYTWLDFNIDGSDYTTTSPITTQSFDAPDRDSFYVNYPDTLFYKLEVVSEYGCIDSIEKGLVVRKPEAYFIPDQVIGVSPMTVTFDEQSYSNEPIVLWEWDFGDGNNATFTTPVDPVHTYLLPGEYFVRLTVTNDQGCKDSSELIKIIVLDISELIVGGMCTANGMSDDFEICVGDSVIVIFDNPYPDLIDFHFNTDDGRYDQCWVYDTGIHTFLYPGEFEMGFSLEHEGFIFFNDRIGTLTVNGAHSKIGFETDCDDIYNVDFESKSINANSLQWFVDGQMVSTEASFKHTFNSLGRHEIELRAEDVGSLCSPHIDTTSVYITDIKADFEVDKNLCDSTFYILDASASLDVHDICHEGYLWNFDHHRPREVGEDSLRHQFPPGRQKITLTTEDINGCKDSMTKWVNVYGMTPEFPIDSNICLPYTADFIDQSIGDTTIVGWDWSFGSTQQNPNFTFTPGDSTGFPGVTLVLTDAIGCTDSIYKEHIIYEPTSGIHVNRGPKICTGMSIQFTADDFTEQGSFLDYNWNFGQYGTTEDASPEITFTDPGLTEVVLNYTENSSGCVGDTTLTVEAVPEPEAAFSTSVDGFDVLCHPETIEFSDQSVTSGPVFTSWDFGNGITSGLDNPAITYDKGIFTTSMIVRSVYGCADTLYRSFELVGPEGEANIDKTAICIGEEITLSISDTVDVNSYTWDFGDGVTIDNQSPVTHAYTLPSAETNVNLILKTTETGCELVRTIPITLHDVFADFSIAEQNGFCDGNFVMENLSLGATSFDWTFNNQTSSSASPSFDFSTPGPVSISLQVTDDQTGCQHLAVKDFILDGEDVTSNMPNVFSPNDDGLNDFFNVITADPMNQEGVEIIDFKIYNRWGKLIYNNDKPETGWDGIYDGIVAPAEVYSYFIEYSINGCNNKNIKGNITLVR